MNAAHDPNNASHDGPRPKARDIALGCGHVDAEMLSDEYWWPVVVHVERLDPPATFDATWLALCPRCHRRYAETKNADSLITHDFVVPHDIDFRPLN